MNTVEFENQLSLFVLEKITASDEIKQELQKVAIVAHEKILVPLIQAAVKNNFKFDSNLPEYASKALKKLCEMHSWQERQYGAIFPMVAKASDILENPKLLQELLQRFSNLLTNVEAIHSTEEMAKLIKLFVDLGFGYFDFFPAELRTKEFNDIKNLVYPSAEEFDIRISRTELGQVAQLAVGNRLGIGTTAKDLTPKEGAAPTARIAGKSVFGSVSIKDRLHILVKAVDKKCENEKYKNILIAYVELKEKLKGLELIPQNEEKIQQLKEQLSKLSKEFGDNHIEKMEHYKIPLLASERTPIETYARKTHFEKLSKGLILIASVSGSTARALVSLLDIGAFTEKNGAYHLKQIQLTANAIMSLFVLGGHHSIVEVGETYNRVLDFLALKNKNTLADINSCVDSAFGMELQMPYYVIGDDESFLEESLKAQFVYAETNNTYGI